MSSDCFASLFCLTTVGLFVVGGWSWRVIRRRLQHLEQRVNTMEVALIAHGIALPAEATAQTVPPTATVEPIDIALAPSEQSPSFVAPTPEPVAPLINAAPAVPPIVAQVAAHRLEAAETATATDAHTIPRKGHDAWKTYPLIEWFINIHFMVQVGIIVLFFGVGFLVKYAVDQGWFPLEIRLVGAATLGLVLAGIGWRVRKKQRAFGLALIGGGIGIIYLTTFGAYYFYHLLSAPVAFSIFVTLAISYVVMALCNDAVLLAFLAVVGAFLAPLLAADGGGNHIILFSYYGVINLGVLAIARFKHWSRLNVASFCFSAVAAVGWAGTAYLPAYFVSTLLFLSLFFIFYLLIAIWSALQGRETDIGDLVILFANPIVSFLLFIGLLQGRGDWPALCALSFALLYGAVSFGISRRVPTTTSLVADAGFFFAVLFATVAVPLRFDAQVTAAIWSAMGTGIIWLNMRRQRTVLKSWGVLVHLLAMGAFIQDFIALPELPTQPFVNHLYLGTLLLSITLLTSAVLLQQTDARRHPDKQSLATPLSFTLFVLGLFWWYGGGIAQFPLYADRNHRLAILLIYLALSGTLGEIAGRWVRWWPLRWTIAAVLPSAAIVAIYLFGWQIHPFTVGWYAWPVLLAVHLLMLQGWHPIKAPIAGSLQNQARGLAIFHAGGIWLLTFLLTWWVGIWADTANLADGWQPVAISAVPLLVLFLLGAFINRMPWPVAANRAVYTLAAAPIALILTLYALGAAALNGGESAPLPFIPLLNPLDLTLALIVVVLWQWWRACRGLWIPMERTGLPQIGVWFVALLILFFVNTAVARAIHHLTALPYTWTALYNSALLQMTYALLWSILALLLMATAHYRRHLQIWYIGATLLGLTVVKLFLIDLAHTETIARIVSFIGVGLLTITVAYFWPAPPRRPTLV